MYAALLWIPTLAVLAEEMPKAETAEGMESAATVFGGDIASGTSDNITWVIDASGKLTVRGIGGLFWHCENIKDNRY